MTVSAWVNLSSVSNWTRIFDARPEWVHGEPERCGVRSRYERPEQLGPDRWAALIAARALRHAPCLVVNAGTATTVDALSADGRTIVTATRSGAEKFATLFGGYFIDALASDSADCDCSPPCLSARPTVASSFCRAIGFSALKRLEKSSRSSSWDTV